MLGFQISFVALIDCCHHYKYLQIFNSGPSILRPPVGPGNVVFVWQVVLKRRWINAQNLQIGIEISGLIIKVVLNKWL